MAFGDDVIHPTSKAASDDEFKDFAHKDKAKKVQPEEIIIQDF